MNTDEQQEQPDITETPVGIESSVAAQPSQAQATHTGAQDQHLVRAETSTTTNTQPALINVRHPQRTAHTRQHTITLFTTFCLLALLVAIGSLFGPQLLQGGLQRVQLTPIVHATPIPTATPTPTPMPTPTMTAAQNAKYLAGLYVSRMNLDEELGQLIMVEYDATSYSDDLDYMLNQLHAGGVIMYEKQMQTLQQTSQDITHMQQRAHLPLLVSTDEEGGPYVHRLLNIYPPRMSATDIGNSGDPAVATREGHRVAHDLLSLGINVNLAPDVDVNLTNGYDQVTRTFGSTPDAVITYAGPYMQAMQSDGVIATLKHFPGLGAATIDAHVGLPVINRSREQIFSVELQPFQHFIQSTDPLEQPGIIMPTDLLMPAIDPVMPAELSHVFMTDILRNQFGYNGVVLTDALYMQGVQINGQAISMSQAGVMALNAGDDMLLGPTGTTQMQDMITALKAALSDGTLSKARVDEAATRIITLKIARHVMQAVPPS